MIKSNCHTHTTYCDGTATAEELVMEALSKGFSCLGFSGHSYLSVDEQCCMSVSGTERYKKEINELREKYRGRLEILCGVEQDLLSHAAIDGYDYVIGSVHYLQRNDVCISVDESIESAVNAVRELYDGCFDAYAEDYFSAVSKVCAATECDVIGHFDLISKFNERLGITESARYLRAAFAALEELVPYGKPFEINTGAMARGYRTSPYPSPAILRRIKEMGGSVIIDSDCHCAGKLDYAFDIAIAHAKEAGFNEVKQLTAAGFCEENI